MSSSREPSTEQPHGLLIQDVAQRTHVSESTLRMWERRHGFPVPARLASGHRRYSEQDVEQILEVLRLRNKGFELPTAIARVTSGRAAAGPTSVMDVLRSSGGHLEAIPSAVVVPAILAAVLDEVALRGGAELLVLGYVGKPMPPHLASRWIDVARTATTAITVGPPETPGVAVIPPSSRALVSAECLLVIEGRTFAGALAARAMPGSGGAGWQMLWTIDPDSARAAANVCVKDAIGDEDRLGATRDRLATRPPPPQVEAESMAILAARIVRYVARAVRSG